MSKVDAQRALREARYARFAAAKAAEPATAVVEPANAPTVIESATAFAAPPVAEHVVAEAVGELCGHTSINGRSCTRPSGHPQKNHRYS